MNIGDRVRLIHSKEEGIITKFLKDNVVEVEIEEGFKLPILKRELAIVSKTEERFFKTNPTQESISKPANTTKIKSEKGIYLAFLPKNEQIFSLYLINNTDFELPFFLTTSIDNSTKGLLAGCLNAKSTEKYSIYFEMKNFENWGIFHFQAFYFSVGLFKEKPMLSKKLRLRVSNFFNHKKNAPIIEKEAFLFQLDEETQALNINAEEVKEKMLEKKVDLQPIIRIDKPSETIDLHIENLSKNFISMSNSEILGFQIKVFEENLEKGIANGFDEMIFIHGVGNGVLRNEIQKKLSNHRNVAWFQDAQKEKFGFGATKVKIK